MGKMNDDLIRGKRRNDMPQSQRKIRDSQTGGRVPHECTQYQLNVNGGRCGGTKRGN